MLSFGIDLGGTNIAAGLVDENGKIIGKNSLPTGRHRPADEIVRDIAKVLRMILEDTKTDLSQVGFCGVSTPGIANQDTLMVDYCSSMPFRDYPLVDKLRELIPIEKMGIENDANAAAKGEAEAGAAKGAKSSVFITLGTGIGGGVIIDGKILRGVNFAGAELGHTVIVKDGEPCGCGRRGCWETYGSVSALIRITKRVMLENKNSTMWELVSGDIEKVNGRTSYAAMKAGDDAAKAVVDEWVDNVACGITNMVNIFQPEILSIGGGISKEGELLLKPIREKVNAEQYARYSKVKTVFRIAELGNDAGIIGAALLYK